VKVKLTSKGQQKAGGKQVCQLPLEPTPKKPGAAQLVVRSRPPEEPDRWGAEVIVAFVYPMRYH
jgi:hypothetical protein